MFNVKNTSVDTGTSYFLENSANKHPTLNKLGIYSHVSRGKAYNKVASGMI